MKVKAIASLETMATVKEIPMDAIGVAVLSEQDNTFSFREEQRTVRNTSLEDCTGLVGQNFHPLFFF